LETNFTPIQNYRQQYRSVNLNVHTNYIVHSYAIFLPFRRFRCFFFFF
jgi:hypothetical protein